MARSLDCRTAASPPGGAIGALVGLLVLVGLVVGLLLGLPGPTSVDANAYGADSAPPSRTTWIGCQTGGAVAAPLREVVGECIDSGASLGKASVATEVLESESDAEAWWSAGLVGVRCHAAIRLRPRGDEVRGQCCLRALLTRAPPEILDHGRSSTSAVAVWRSGCA